MDTEEEGKLTDQIWDNGILHLVYCHEDELQYLEEKKLPYYDITVQTVSCTWFYYQCFITIKMSCFQWFNKE